MLLYGVAGKADKTQTPLQAADQSAPPSVPRGGSRNNGEPAGARAARRGNRETQLASFQRLAVEIDVETFRRLHFQPWHPRADEQAFHSVATAEQGAQGTDHVLRRRQDAHVQQAVVHSRLRTQYVPAAGLAPVTDAQGEELAFPLEVRGAETALGGMHFGKRVNPVNR